MIPKVLVLQRQTNVADKPIPSRSVFARILEPFDYLKDQGKINYNIIDESQLKFEDLSYFGIIILQKHSSQRSVMIAEEAKRRGLKIIYDIDDFLPAFPQYSGGQGMNAKINVIKQHTAIANVVTVATPVLQREVDRFFSVKSFLAPNGINVERHRAFLKPKRNFRIIFTNADMLKVNSFKSDLFNLINYVTDHYSGVELDIISDPNPELVNFNKANLIGNFQWFEHKRWLAEQAYSVGIVPLGGVEDPEALLFNSCKSPIKYLEYGALDIVGIYSKSPIYNDVIVDGQTGILVENTFDSWRVAFEMVFESTDFRTKITKNALADINENYHVRLSSTYWMDLLNSVSW